MESFLAPALDAEASHPARNDERAVSSTGSTAAFAVAPVVAVVACSAAAVVVAVAGSAAVSAAFVAAAVAAAADSTRTGGSRNRTPLAACHRVSDASLVSWRRYEWAKWATKACFSLAMASPCSWPAATASCWIAPSVVATDCYRVAITCSPCPALVVDEALAVGRES